RLKAAEAEIDALKSRVEHDPTTYGQLISAIDQIEEAGAGTEIAPLAAFNRVWVTAEAPPSILPEGPEKLDRMVSAVRHLANVHPPHLNASAVVNKMAKTAEAKGEPKVARELYTLLSERFPDSAQAKFAVGALKLLDSQDQ